ncbi:MAG TPA: hypothetical protein VFV08_04520 [Puia sp.]|nr:hypothetical protein [Puia sp.]
MKQFVMEFDYKNRHYKADVTEIGGLDGVQYAISQRDEDLAEQFGEVVVRKPNTNGEFQYNLPPGKGSDEFMNTLVAGLRKYL